jgi:hypothetical protein
VTDYVMALPWYEKLLGKPPSFFPTDSEAVWELADHRFLYIVELPQRAGLSVMLMFVDDLDGYVAAISARGIEPAQQLTLGNGVRKVTYRDADGNEISLGAAPA